MEHPGVVAVLADAELLLEGLGGLLGNDAHANPLLPFDLVAVAEGTQLVHDDHRAEVDECRTLAGADPDVHAQWVVLGLDLHVFDCVARAVLAVVVGRLQDDFPQLEHPLDAGAAPLGLALQPVQQVLHLLRGLGGLGRDWGLLGLLPGQLLLVLGQLAVLGVQLECLVLDPLLQNWDLRAA